MTDSNLRGYKFLPYKQGVAGSNPAPPTPILYKPLTTRGLRITGYNIGKTNLASLSSFAAISRQTA